MVHIDENSVAIPLGGDLDFKELFQEAISARVGLSMTKPAAKGPEWTPSLLAEAILEADPRGLGVDVRTVQNWFQDNDKGISSDNIVCLARVFGVGDPDAIAAWRTELRAANKRLASKRRSRRENVEAMTTNEDAADGNSSSYRADKPQVTASSFAGLSERVFTNTDGFGIAVIVWAGFFLLCLMSFVVGNHDITYAPQLGVNKQVGFFWSLSWPVECLLLYPASFLLIANIVSFWKREISTIAQSEVQQWAWSDLIFSLRLPLWVAAMVAFVLVFAVQWGGVYFLGLTQMDTPGLVDWILVAQLRPDVVSFSEALVISLYAFLYSGLIYWFYFIGLLLLYATSEDYYRHATSPDPSFDGRPLEFAGLKLQVGIFRCTVIGILIATAIQLNAIYLKSDGETSIGWLANDFLAGLDARTPDWAFLDQSSVSSLTSSILLLLHVALLGVCTAKVRPAMRASVARKLKAQSGGGEDANGRRERTYGTLPRQLCILGLLCLNFSLLGQFVGFTLLLLASVFVAVVGIFWSEPSTEFSPNAAN